MGNEDQSIAEGSRVAPFPHSTTAPNANWRLIAVAAGAGAAVGLAIGIFVGRATVDAAQPPVVTAQKALEESKPEAEVPPDPSIPARDYRVELGRQVPGGKASRGLGRELNDKRPVARLDGANANLHFPYKAMDGESYAFTAIVQLDASNSADLQVGFDGQRLGTWALSKGWGFYSSAVPDDLLSQVEHDVILVAEKLPKDGVVRFDSVAVLPVQDELSFSIGKDSRGHLVDGFSRPETRSVWSDGPRSVIGAVLAPRSSAYEVHVRSSAYPPVSPLTVRLRVNGVDAGTATVTKKIEDAGWTIPPKALRAGANQLAFEYSQTGEPAKLKPGSKDQRALAMRFFSVDLVPRD